MLRQMRSARRRRRRRQCFAQHADQEKTLLWGDDYCEQGCLVLQGSRKQILRDCPSAPGNAEGSVKTLDCTAMHHQGRQDIKQQLGVRALRQRSGSKACTLC